MKFLIVAVLALVAPSAWARPQEHPAAAPQHAQQQNGPTTEVTIVSQTEVVNADGSFNFSYETSNGIHVEQGGYVKKATEARSSDPNNPNADEESNGDVQVIQGAYSYTAPDGQQISLNYVADENGFQPQGAHLPTAPPTAEAVGRSLGQEDAHQQPQHPAQQQPQHPAQQQPQQQPQ